MDRRLVSALALSFSLAVVGYQVLTSRDPSAMDTYGWNEGTFCSLAIPLIDGEPWRVTVHGDIAQSPSVWGVDAKGRRVLLQWPEGTSVTFDPALAIDWDGRAILHAGDVVTSETPAIGCGVGFRLA